MKDEEGDEEKKQENYGVSNYRMFKQLSRQKKYIQVKVKF